VRCPKHGFLSRDNPHLIIQFCRVELDPIQSSRKKKVMSLKRRKNKDKAELKKLKKHRKSKK
jgi:hypothetical protein